MLDLFKKKESVSDTAPRPAWRDRLKAGLARTRNQMAAPLASLWGGGHIDEALYEELETLLLTADCGPEATQRILEQVREAADRHTLKDAEALRKTLRDALTTQLAPLAVPLDTQTHHPFVLLLVGVNGAGKTTTIGKLAYHLQTQGQSVLIAAGDTFRAAAREQLAAWGERNRVHVVSQENSDPAAVIFDAIHSARARGIDVVIADTAGRLPTQIHLMEELKKVQRVIGKALPGAPHEVLLVLDAGTGQNAVAQVKAFDDALGVTGLVLTKLDGTAKGGVIAAIAKTRAIPVRFIGVGEQLEDLQPFNADEFSEALFS